MEINKPSMNKFKCRHCKQEVNMILVSEGFKGCLECLGDKVKNKKVGELNV